MLVLCLVVAGQSILVILVVGESEAVGNILVHVGLLLLYGIENLGVCYVALVENLSGKVVFLL